MGGVGKKQHQQLHSYSYIVTPPRQIVVVRVTKWRQTRSESRRAWTLPANENLGDTGGYSYPGVWLVASQKRFAFRLFPTPRANGSHGRYVPSSEWPAVVTSGVDT